MTATTMHGCVAAATPSGTPITSSGEPEPSQPVSPAPSPTFPPPTATIGPPILDPNTVFQVGHELVTFDGQHRFAAPEGELALAVDGTRIVTVSASAVAVCDIRSGEREYVHPFEGRAAGWPVMTAGTIRLVAGSDDPNRSDSGVIRLDVATDREVLAVPPRAGPGRWFRAPLRRSPSGLTVASSGSQLGSDDQRSDETRIVDVVDAQTGTLRSTFEHEGTNLVALNDDVIVATEGTFTEAYRIDTGERIWELRPDTATLPGVVTADGDRLVVAVLGQDARTIDVIEMATGARINRCPIEPLSQLLPTISDPQVLLMRDAETVDLTWVNLQSCESGALVVGGGVG